MVCQVKQADMMSVYLPVLMSRSPCFSLLFSVCFLPGEVLPVAARRERELQQRRHREGPDEEMQGCQDQGESLCKRWRHVNRYITWSRHRPPTQSSAQ